MTKTTLAKFLFSIIVTICLTNTASADRLGFGRFEIDASTLPKSYQRLRKIEGIKAKRIHAFSIYGGECASPSYGDGTVKGDCSYGSVRSWLRESKSDGRWVFPQPTEAWYGWDMLIPETFPTLGTQTYGQYTFVGWKGYRCSHASISHSTRKGENGTIYLRLEKPVGDPSNHDCKVTAEIPLMKMNQFKGQWRNFRIFAKWTDQPDGQIIVYLDGKRVANYNGPTLNVPVNDAHEKAKMNHFDFGIYLCCTAGVRNIKSGTVYFANVKRAGSQKKLAK